MNEFPVGSVPDTDDLDLQLEALDDDQRRAVPAWRDLLHRVIGSPEYSTDAKAGILGVPTPGRRQVFQMGGTALIGAAILAACGSTEDQLTAEGITTTTRVPPVTDPGGGVPMDLILTRTAASLEQLAIDVYTEADLLAELPTRALREVMEIIEVHHQEHRNALNSVLHAHGYDMVDEPNEAVFNAVVQPVLEAGPNEESVLQVSLEVEQIASQTYTYAAGELTEPALRSTMMTIAGIEARHAALLIVASQGRPPAEVFGGGAFYAGSNPLPEGAVLS